MQIREFSKFEKVIINKIIELDEIPGSLNVLGNILDDLFYPHYYIQFESETDCMLKIEKRHFDELVNKYSTIGLSTIIKEITEKLLFVVRLINFLVENDYLLLYEEVDFNTLGTNTVNAIYINYEIKDLDLKKALYAINRRKIKPTDILKQFVNNDYKTDTELEKELADKKAYRKILFGQRITLITVVLTAIGIFLPNIIELIKLRGNNKPYRIEIVNKKIGIETNCCDSISSNEAIILKNYIYFKFNEYIIRKSKK